MNIMIEEEPRLVKASTLQPGDFAYHKQITFESNGRSIEVLFVRSWAGMFSLDGKFYIPVEHLAETDVRPVPVGSTIKIKL